MMDKDRITRAFDRYVAAYDAGDPKIALKIHHTYRVAALCARIAEGVAEADLAWLCGMLHDIGRFEQVARYGTFIDNLSVDHAALGADLLFREGLIRSFCPEGADRETLALLECAIRNHNAYRLPEDLSERERTYCDILRDADKIDIFRANCDTPKEDIYNVTTEELRSAGVSTGVKDCFLRRMAVPRGVKQTAADHLVGHLCLVFELVYPISRQIAREQGYVDQILNFESDNPDTRAWFDFMKARVWA